MNNPFKYSLDNKRYHTLNYHMKSMFNQRVFKAVINAGFTCPNIDGKCGYGGCTYCHDGSGEFTLSSSKSIQDQILAEQNRIYEKWGKVGIIAYFQSHTNTYAPLKELKSIYESVLEVDGVVGISIATRADCLDDEKITYLKELSNQTYLTVELGLQTIHDTTAKLINRCHDFNTFLIWYNKLKERGIRVCVHIIDGLPGENFDMMIQTAKTIGKLKPDAVKIHLLHIMEGTAIAQQYYENKLIPMEKRDYIDIVCSQLEYLPPETVIERITGDGSKEKLIAPRWSIDKISVLSGIDKTLADRNTWQGKNFINL